MEEEDEVARVFTSDQRYIGGLLADSMPFSPDDTIKPNHDRFKRTTNNPRVDLSRGDLIRLLSYLEGELQARDIVIATLKAEKAKQLLYQAKYGRLGLNDPLAALQRDSESVGARDDFDEAAVGRMYESQLAQLEKLISAQRRAQHRSKQVLAAAERRHARTIRELEHEKQRKAADAAQGDDVCMRLEKEREKLKHEIEYQKNEQEKIEKSLEKARDGLNEEKERHKAIVMYLMNERKQLLTRLMEERQKNKTITASGNPCGSSSFQATSSLDLDQKMGNFKQNTQKGQKKEDDESRTIKMLEQRLKQIEKDMETVKADRESLKKQLGIIHKLRDNYEEREENASLKEIVRTQEEDLSLIRQNILAKTRQLAEKNQQQQIAGPPEPPPKVAGPKVTPRQPAPPAYGAATAGRSPSGAPVAYRGSSSGSTSPVSPVGAKYPSSSTSSHYASTGGLVGVTGRPITPGSQKVGLVPPAGRTGTPGFPVNSEELRIGTSAAVKNVSGQQQTKHQVQQLPHQYASTGSVQGLGAGPRVVTGRPGITMVARPTVLSAGSNTISASTSVPLKRQVSAPSAPPSGPPPAPPTTVYASSSIEAATYPGNFRHQEQNSPYAQGNVSSYTGFGEQQIVNLSSSGQARIRQGSGSEGLGGSGSMGRVSRLPPPPAANSQGQGQQQQRRKANTGTSGSAQENNAHKKSGENNEDESEPEIARLEAVINSVAADVQKFGETIYASRSDLARMKARQQNRLLVDSNDSSSLKKLMISKSMESERSANSNNSNQFSSSSASSSSSAEGEPAPNQPGGHNSNVVVDSVSLPPAAASSAVTTNQIMSSTAPASTTPASNSRYHMRPGRLARPASVNSLANGASSTGVGMEKVAKRTPTPFTTFRIPLPPVMNGPSGIPTATQAITKTSGTIKRNPLQQQVVVVGKTNSGVSSSSNIKIVGKREVKKATQV